MFRSAILLLVVCTFLFPIPSSAQIPDYVPVTREMLLDPSPDDWLMYSRTYDGQRFSPLDQINRQNVGQLRMVWSRGLPPGIHEHIPLVHDGVLFVANPGGVQALDATNGDLIWEHHHELPEERAGRTIALYEDLILYAPPKESLVALDARTGAVRWQARTPFSSSGPRVVDDKVIAGMADCSGMRDCILALNAKTGDELWRFYTAPAPGEPGGDSWAAVPLNERSAEPWGLPGSFDPVRGLVYWGIANPTPYTRIQRHGGNPDAIPRSAPAELYTNSTVALDPGTGKLSWYYQHLPGDDWDQDFPHDRILLRTPVNPDPASVKWMNPRIPPGQERDVLVTVGETGGIFVLDREDGEFLWATPFPYDVPEFPISKVDVETGKTYINWDQVFQKDGDTRMVCFQNSRGYWPLAYHPSHNSLYIPYHDECIRRTINMENERWDSGEVIRRPGSDPDAFGGIAKVNMSTGEIQRFYTAPIAGNGAMLATAGDLIFWGDLNRRLRAFDAGSGRILWETIIGGIIQNSTITYGVDGKQYIAVMTGDGEGHTRTPLRLVPEIKPPRGHNAVYVFALP